MYVNIGGRVDLLYSGDLEARVSPTPWSTENLIWVYLNHAMNECLYIICHPSNVPAAQEICDRHNEIYNSPLAKALREEE